jgi:hypothetical protein
MVCASTGGGGIVSTCGGGGALGAITTVLDCTGAGWMIWTCAWAIEVVANNPSTGTAKCIFRTNIVVLRRSNVKSAKMVPMARFDFG